MAQVADALLGQPNARLSNDKHARYGTNGSLHIDLATGTFYDHETKSGGGVLDLISRVTGRDHRGAVDWMHEQGYLEPNREPLNGKSTLGKIVATYDYVDENDELVFQVVRFEPKTFRQRRRDETGAWSWSVKGLRRIPYRLPDLIEAVAMEHTIYIVEGEKDVERLRKLGLSATCNAGGAGKWHADLSQYLHGADVVIIPDNDQSGQDHAASIAASLLGIAASIRVLDLIGHWPSIPVKGDVSDWLDRADGASDAIELHTLASSVPQFTTNPFVSKFGGQAWEDIGTAGAAACYPWLVENVIPLGEIAMAFGDTGTGKSYNILDLAMCVARGLKFNGHNVKSGLVIYVAAEAGKGFAKRKIAYAIQNKLEPSEPLPFYLLTKRPNFYQDDKDAILLIEEIEAVRRRYKARLVLIVIDTVSAATQGMDEISGKDQAVVRKRFLMLQEAFNATVLVVHHKPKNGNGPRGHGSQTADIETTIEFETMRDCLRATVRKQREGKKGIFWEFILPEIEVGLNEWGNPETACVVQPLQSSRKVEKVGFHATPTEALLLRALYDALSDHPSPPPAGLPPSITKVVEQRYVRVLMRERYIAPDEDSTAADGRFRTAFSRAAAKLRDGAVIGVQGNLLWPTGKPVNGFSGPTIEGP